MNIENSVYRFLNNDNEIIYIGKAKNLKNRISGHSHLPKECYDEIYKIEYTAFDTEDDMDFAERYFISKIKPKYNEIHKGKEITIYVPELEYSLWNGYDEFRNNVSLDNYMENMSIEKECERAISYMDNEISKNETKLELLNNLRHDDRIDVSVHNELFNAIHDDVKRLKQDKFRMGFRLLKIRIGQEEFDNIPDWKKNLMVDYETTDCNEIIELNIKSIVNDTTDLIISKIEKDGFFDVNNIKFEICSHLEYDRYKNNLWLKLIDEEIDTKTPPLGNFAIIKNPEEVVERIYNDCLNSLTTVNKINFKQDIFITKEKQMFRNIVTDVPKIIMKVA